MNQNNSNDSPLVIQRLSDVQPEAISWLWPNCLAIGKLTLVGGNPGVGKSQVAASITGTVSGGGSFPGSDEPVNSGSVIFVGVEDGLADTLRPRMEAAGANLNRVNILQGKREYTSNGHEVTTLLDVTKDLNLLSLLVKQLGDVRLIILDPVNDYVGPGKQSDNAEMRKALVPLANFAEEHELSVLAITHLKKSAGGGDPIDAFISSRAFTGVARCVFAVAKDNEDDDKRVFVSVKNNVAKDTGGYSFRVEGCQIDGGIETSKVIWDKKALTKTADELMRDPMNGREDKTALGEAVEFLDEWFFRQPIIKTKEMESEARKEGISQSTLRRARAKLNAKKGRDNSGWYWCIPESERTERYQDRPGTINNPVN